LIAFDEFSAYVLLVYGVRRAAVNVFEVFCVVLARNYVGQGSSLSPNYRIY